MHNVILSTRNLSFRKLSVRKLSVRKLSVFPAFLVIAMAFLMGPLTAEADESASSENVSNAASPADTVRSWDPQRTLVFIAGVLRWRDKSYAQFTPKARRDAELAEFFRAQGVPSDKLVYISDAQATLSNLENSFDDLLEKSSEGDTLIFYYCGHGWLDNSGNGYYANYDVSTNDNAISTRAIASKLKKNFRGSQALFFADCCSSGSIGLSLNKQPGNYQFGMVTSAAPPVSSTSNWTFSQALLDGLRGHKFVDLDADGKVSFVDLAKYVVQEMKSIDNQAAGVNSSNGFPGNFCLSKVNFPNEVIPRLVEAKYGTKWYKAKLMEEKDRQARVRWVQIGYDTADSDEWCDFNKVREIGGAPLNGLAPATARSEFQIGDTCEVLWKNEFWPAKVLKRRDNEYFVHYDGYDSSWDEWVSLSRMK